MTTANHPAEYFLLDFLIRNGGNVKYANLPNAEQAMASDMAAAGLLVLADGLVSILA
ncbi:hypothetical protein SAMN04488069_12920 [Hymenobacter psychrophilus]|uniref:Uncharacterized protein n=2 Tax=Hymenobacter psychrophilus TaxID=651662 RepID=A0A1H3PEB4_9BACT|nr:hypothetical protein SAMN04488069_12920 [Hymenobacter psychrophilus]